MKEIFKINALLWGKGDGSLGKDGLLHEGEELSLDL